MLLYIYTHTPLTQIYPFNGDKKVFFIKFCLGAKNHRRRDQSSTERGDERNGVFAVS